MGAVYLVEHAALHKRMAMKVLHDEYAMNDDLAKRFQMEAMAASMIGQENIVDVTDFGKTTDGRMYFVMEYLDGIDLGKLIKNGKGVEAARSIRILRQVCGALAAAHGHGIIHRDLKPENIILVNKAGTQDFVKLLDFGISKMTDASLIKAERLTMKGVVFGTPEYMSPEQAGGLDVDFRSDIYSLGVIMYEMLTGKLPFEGDNSVQIISRKITGNPESPGSLRPELDIPYDFEKLVMRCLDKNRDSRPRNVGEISGELERIGNEIRERCDGRRTLAWSSAEGELTGSPDIEVREGGDSSRTIIKSVGPKQTAVAKKSESPVTVDPIEVVEEIPIIVPGKRSRLLWIVIPVSLLILGFGIWSLLRTGPDENTASQQGPIVDGGGAGVAVIPVVPMKDGGIESTVTPVKVPQANEKKESPAQKQPVVASGNIERGIVAVEVTTVPSGAEVYEGGKFYGMTPVKIRGRKGEERTYTFKSAGYASETVAIYFDRSRPVRIELKQGKSGSYSPSQNREDVLKKIKDTDNPFR